MIVVTGGAGFIGSNIVKALNNNGETNIIIVDDLTDGRKFSNIADLKFRDYLDKDNLIQTLNEIHLKEKIESIFHEGACSDTTEWNGKFMLDNNYEYSKKLFHFSQENKISFIYASSAAVYGLNTTCIEEPSYETPLNVYGFSKLLFDNYVRQHQHLHSQVIGLRYFNVYGPREQHKGKMASVAYHCTQQLLSGDKVKLFEGSGGYENGEQRRDFISVKDVAKVNLWFRQHPEVSGIFNVGTGRSQTFKEVAQSVINYRGKGEIEYIPFPDQLKGRYQHFTQADIASLRKAGYEAEFLDVQNGVKDYLDEIHPFSIE
jgi:ADP-L-glycero-D-manno-heptose 6-epimerase